MIYIFMYILIYTYSDYEEDPLVGDEEDPDEGDTDEGGTDLIFIYK
jgi:hypothetical protein